MAHDVLHWLVCTIRVYGACCQFCNVVGDDALDC